MAITALHTFGWEWENRLKPFIESHLGYEVAHTECRYDSVDFKTIIPYANCELKSRPRISESGWYQDSNSWETWYVPVCKCKRNPNGITRFYYFWEADASLWYCDYDPKKFRGLEVWHNKNGQPTVRIPKCFFTQIPF